MGYDASPDALDRDLVFDFFWHFSVFECALEREGYLKAGRGDYAQADWKAFAETIHGRFEVPCGDPLQEAINVLRGRPPRRQIVRDGRLAWGAVERSSSFERYVLTLVKTTRNNLFHGGKYPDGDIAEVERDRTLLQAALKVLERCYELHPGLARWRDAA